jgi:hypothetical protein
MGLCHQLPSLSRGRLRRDGLRGNIVSSSCHPLQNAKMQDLTPKYGGSLTFMIVLGCCDYLDTIMCQMNEDGSEFLVYPEGIDTTMPQFEKFCVQ